MNYNYNTTASLIFYSRADVLELFALGNKNNVLMISYREDSQVIL
ncbi:MAG TPA: hypothetical protein VD815_00275 [Candidatus Saccharimonadales bacterium]|nr:hypothetical protein [Candidatus Saccharimonadales bacterium]